MYRIAIDIGGTFTDLVTETPEGETRSTKVLSTPEELVKGVMNAVEAAEIDLDQVSLFVHGTTAGLNALLQRRGAKVALVTTRGFRDVYLIGRGSRPAMYDIHYKKPAPLLDRAGIFEVDERLNADGSELTPIDVDSVRKVADAIRGEGYTSIAVCLIHAYANGEHERQVRDVLAESLPDIPLSLSHEVSPVWREYERTSTTVMSAYITPIMSTYLAELENELHQHGLSVPVYITESNGGVMTAAMAASKSVLTLFSGPVGGVVGVRSIGADIGQANLIGIDIGGTSFDVSLVQDGQVSLQPEYQLQGLPILAPAVEVNTIGAGGGSLIWQDAGRLHVGPESAGAQPGPASYGFGGDQPTVTDANVVLGRLPARQRLAGTLALDVSAARSALSAVGEKLGLDAASLGEQALEVTHFKMAEAIRELTVERGLDPRDFTLCAFGGAGGLHAAALADELGIEKIIVPALPGAFSAWGMLQSGVRHDAIRTFYRPLADAAPQVAEALGSLHREMTQILAAEGVPEAEQRFEAAADLRYTGQEYSLTLGLDSWDSVDGLADRFHEAYDARYGHSNRHERVEFAALRLAGLAAPADRLRSPTARPRPGEAVEVVYTRFGGRDLETGVFRRDAMPEEVEGPAIVLEANCTTLVPPDWSARVIEDRHLMLERGAH